MELKFLQSVHNISNQLLHFQSKLKILKTSTEKQDYKTIKNYNGDDGDISTENDTQYNEY